MRTWVRRRRFYMQDRRAKLAEETKSCAMPMCKDCLRVGAKAHNRSKCTFCKANKNGGGVGSFLLKKKA